jgi:hypothetical protein
MPNACHNLATKQTTSTRARSARKSAAHDPLVNPPTLHLTLATPLPIPCLHGVHGVMRPQGRHRCLQVEMHTDQPAGGALEAPCCVHARQAVRVAGRSCHRLPVVAALAPAPGEHPHNVPLVALLLQIAGLRKMEFGGMRLRAQANSSYVFHVPSGKAPAPGETASASRPPPMQACCPHARRRQRPHALHMIET